MDLVALLAVAYFAWRYITRNASSGGVVPVEPSPVDYSGDGTDTASYDPIDSIVAGWARFEGYFQPGSLASRNNNPGNLKGDYPGVIGHTPQGFAIFGSSVDGWNAAQGYVERNAAQHPDWTFQNFFAKVLGSLSGTPVNNDQGNSNNEAQFVADYSGVDPSTQVSSYLGSDS